MATFTVVDDTNVLVPAPLRDLLLRVTEAGLVRAAMGEGILDEEEREKREAHAALVDHVRRVGGTLGGTPPDDGTKTASGEDSNSP